MTNKGKVLAAVIAVVVVLAGGVGLYLKGGDLMGKIFKVVPTLNVSLHASTPNVSILVAGEQFQPVASFKLVAGSEDLTIDSLSINCTGGDGALGSADNNIVSVKVFGGDVNKTSYLTNGVASFTGLKLFIPKDSDVVLNVNVDLNTIPNGATSGEYFHFSVGNIKAVGVASAMSATVKKTGIQESKNMHVYETEPYLTLNSKSPSGNKTPAASDTVMKFDIKANSREKVKIEKISFALASNAVFDTTPATTVTAYLKNISSSSRSGKIVASGRVDIVSTSLATVELLPIGILEIPKGTTVTYSLELNTQSMITQSVNDDLLTPSLSVSIIPGMNGGFWWNDTNNTVKWVDAASVPNGSFDLKGHTLTY